MTSFIEIQNLLNKHKNWQQKYRELMLLGKSLPSMPSLLKTDDVLIDGCESSVWLRVELDDDYKVVIVADSDTRIVKGLIAVITSLFQQLDIEEAKNVDAFKQFDTLGLIQHLSPSRGNGIRAIVNTITERLNQF